jgi:hypothetical protein
MPIHDYAARKTPRMIRRRTAIAARGVGVDIVARLSTCLVAGALACGKESGPRPPLNPPVAGKISATMPTPVADSDSVARHSGLPAGYAVVFDHSGASVSSATYSEKETGRWEVTTGAPQILYSPRDSALNRYIVSATFEQLQAPSHPAAFGVFIGGANLKTPKVRYTYFMVRGDGRYAVIVRDGADTRTLTDWTAQPVIPRQDAAGKGLYGIKIDVKAKTAKVSVNGAPITTISGKNIPLNGVTGVRIDDGLHLIVTPVSVIR